jgi:prepilin peptidase CpaA
VWTNLTPSPPLIQWGVVLGATLAAAVTDLSSRRIPNLLTLPLALGGVIWSIGTAENWWLGAADSLMACVVLALPFVLLFVFAGGGAGDAKLMGAVGAWLGLIQGGAVLLAVALCGVALALAYAAAQGQLRSVLANINGVLVAWSAAARSRRGFGASVRNVPTAEGMTTIPYGVAIFLGVCLAAGALSVGGYLSWHA